MSLANKVAIVTGASSGIGAATAVLFAEEGADVAIVARTQSKLEEVAKKIQALGRKALVITADLSKESDVAKIVPLTVQHFGKLDILVNNAGINMPGGGVTSDTVLQAYDQVMQTNVRAVIQLTNLAAPHLAKTKGNIVNVSSAASLRSSKMPGMMVYPVSKAALDHFTKCAAVDLAQSGVRVNEISPGPVDNDFPVNNGFGDILTRDKRVSGTALGFMAASEEIGGVILFLASDKAKSVTGANYTIDNGYTIKH